MSHSSAQFHFPNGTELHGEYDGTSDVMLPRMFSDYRERDSQWRKQEWPKEKCPHEPESCTVHSDYGGGFSWPGTACRTCMVFLGPYEPEHVLRDPRPSAPPSPSV